MILFRVILLFFIFISPLKANTIYNLIKIPNLEIYETLVVTYKKNDNKYIIEGLTGNLGIYSVIKTKKNFY